MLEYDFIRHAFIASAIVALLAGAVGYFLVLRGQTFAGHALAHVGFTGATGALLVGFPPLAGLVVASVAAGAAMGAMSEKSAQRDVAIGLVLSLTLGIGLLFLHFMTTSATQATALLFGNVLAVSVGTIQVLLVLAVVSLGWLAIISRPLLFVSLQPELAQAKGLRPRRYSIAFLVITAMATAESVQIVGVLLVFALMVGPAATALRLTNNVLRGIVLSMVIALVEAWLGIVLAYYSDWPTTFWIAALSAGFYAAAYATDRMRLRLPMTRFFQYHTPVNRSTQ
ncbi:metal ABC transporter permease [Pseudomonas sp. TE3610]